MINFLKKINTQIEIAENGLIALEKSKENREFFKEK